MDNPNLDKAVASASWYPGFMAQRGRPCGGGGWVGRAGEGVVDWLASFGKRSWVQGFKLQIPAELLNY